MEVMVYNSVCRKGQNRQTCAESGSSREGTVWRVVSREAANELLPWGNGRQPKHDCVSCMMPR